MMPVGGKPDQVGTVCNKPASNTACRVLPRIAETKDDGAETAVASKSLPAARAGAEVSPDQLPPCIAERANFMAPFPISITKRHPYAERNSESHGHFRQTPYRMPPSILGQRIR